MKEFDFSKLSEGLIFCVRKGPIVSPWFNYASTVNDFLGLKKEFLNGKSTFVFIENEHVWIYESGELFECPFIPDWCPEPYSD